MKHARTAYDVRRYLTLVQVLAGEDYLERLWDLAQLWDVEITSAEMEDDDALIHKLAQAVVEYHREDTP